MDETSSLALRRESPYFVSPSLLGLMILVMILAASVRLNTPYVVLAPGPTRDVAKLTKIEGQTFSSQGAYHLTTTLLRFQEGATPLQLIEGWADRDLDVVARSLVFPKGSSLEEAEERVALQMSESQQTAAIAAFRELGTPPSPNGAAIRTVLRGTPAEAEFEPGDVLIGVDEGTVSTPKEIAPLVRRKPIGSVLEIVVRRGDETRHLRVKTIESKEKRGQPVLGITVQQSYQMPVDVSIDSAGIGGPSAGLVFALSIYDLLIPEDLTGGRIIAGTGSIDSEGKVSGVGAIEQKIRGAEKIKASIFFVPMEDVSKARRSLKTDMRIIGVSTLKEAVASLRSIR